MPKTSGSSLCFSQIFNPTVRQQSNTKSLAWIYKKVFLQNFYDVISPSFDTLFIRSVLFFVQIEIPCHSLHKMMGRFPPGE